MLDILKINKTLYNKLKMSQQFFHLIIKSKDREKKMESGSQVLQ